MLHASLHGILPLFPARNAFLQYLHITIALTIQMFIGQTGQLVRAASIQHHRDVARNFRETLREFIQWQQPGAGQMRFVVT
jgi:hypothetical protein